MGAVFIVCLGVAVLLIREREERRLEHMRLMNKMEVLMVMIQMSQGEGGEGNITEVIEAECEKIVEALWKSRGRSVPK